MSNKNKEISQSEKKYYKLNSKAVDRLTTVNKSNAKKVSDEELKKYHKSFLSRLPIWFKACFIKFWFAGSVCFFFYWGTGAYIASWLDTIFVLGLAMGITTDVLTKNIMRFISGHDKEYYPYMIFTSTKYWTLVAYIAYSFLVLTLTILIYSVIRINVEPVLFGIIFTAIDVLIIKLKDYIVLKIRK